MRAWRVIGGLLLLLVGITLYLIFLPWWFLWPIFVLIGITLFFPGFEEDDVSKNANNPVTVLKLRYVKGEITKEQFEEMMTEIS